MSGFEPGHTLQAGAGLPEADREAIRQYEQARPALEPLEDDALFVGEHVLLPIEGAGPGGEPAPPGPVLDEYPRGLHWFDNVDMGEALLRLPYHV